MCMVISVIIFFEHDKPNIICYQIIDFRSSNCGSTEHWIKQRPQLEDEHETQQSHQMIMEDHNNLLSNDNNHDNHNNHNISISENQPNFDENYQIKSNSLISFDQLNNNEIVYSLPGT